MQAPDLPFDRKVIISCAVTGSVHTPSMSPHLPITPEEIAKGAIEAAEAGASIVHLHARNPETGIPTGDPEVFRRFCTPIKKESDVVINITTGGGHNMTVEQRLAAALELEPEICSFDSGSTNFSIKPLVGKREFQQEWERPHLVKSHDFVYKNTFDDMESMCKLCRPKGIRFECEVFNISFLTNLKYLWSVGLLEPPFWIQGVFGILGGMTSDYQNMVYMKERCDAIFRPENYYFSALGAGPSQMRNGVFSALMGGHCRVGLEDSLYVKKGKLATSNAEQVLKMRHTLEELGFTIATPTDVREMLKLKGRDNVRF